MAERVNWKIPPDQDSTSDAPISIEDVLPEDMKDEIDAAHERAVEEGDDEC